jgi:hypothetical protein
MASLVQKLMPGTFQGWSSLVWRQSGMDESKQRPYHPMAQKYRKNVCAAEK